MQNIANYLIKLKNITNLPKEFIIIKTSLVMGCGQALPEDRGGSASRELTIWGDYFNGDTRAILAICEMAEVQHDFKLVDSF